MQVLFRVSETERLRQLLLELFWLKDQRWNSENRLHLILIFSQKLNKPGLEKIKIASN